MLEKLRSLRHRHQAYTQNFISGWILFFTVGVYLAVLGLGAGGGKPSSQRVSDIGNSSLYAIFAIFGPFAGSIMNHLGPRNTMLLGIFGYPIYVAGFFYYDNTGREWFPVFSGVILGFAAPLLWSVSGYIQWAYSTEIERGEYISTQYFINQMGSVLGALVAFIIILKGEAQAEGSPTPVYIAFLCLMCTGFVCGLGLVDPKHVVRVDGTNLAEFRAMTWKEELSGMFEVLKDRRVLLMVPVIFGIEMPLAVIPAINGAYFNLRTRAMNSVMFYAISLPASILVTILTDKLPFGRRGRGFASVGFIAILSTSCWLALTVWVSVSHQFNNPPSGGVDWTGGAEFAGPFVLYVLFGVTYTMHQLIGLWIMGTFTNSPQALAIFGGLFKGIAGGGLAVAFGINSAGVSAMGISLFVLILQSIGFVIMFIVVYKYVQETNYGQEVDVIMPHYASTKHDAGIILDGLPASATTTGMTGDRREDLKDKSSTD